jgi:cobalt-zinc-cadmium resistance protein CzcA
VGFIVLFGVAVLNGLVLISRFNSLKQEGISDIAERINVATHERLRPILLTAVAAMLGFLPMAISGSAGAEVQRPLATVVIGGLFSATLLTLVVVPILYALVEARTERKRKRKLNSGLTLTLVLLFGLGMLFTPATTQAQQADTLQPVTLEQAVKMAKTRFPAMKAARLEVENQKALKRTAWDIGNTEVSTGAEELGNNTTDGITNVISIRQEFDILSVNAKNKVANQKISLSETALQLTGKEITREVSKAWGAVYVTRQRYLLYTEMDTLMKTFARAARLRFETEATSKLEYLSAQNQVKQVEAQKRQAYRDYLMALQQLNMWLVSDTLFTAKNMPAQKLEDASLLLQDSVKSHPLLQFYNQKLLLANEQYRLAKTQYLPKFSLLYGSQKIGGQPGFYKYEIGLSIPLVFAAQSGRTKSANIGRSIAKENLLRKTMEVQSQYQNLMQEYKKWLTTWRYYRSEALPVAREQRRGAMLAYRQGAIGYVAFLQNVRDAMQLEFNAQKAFANFLNARFNLEYFNRSTNQKP